MTILLGIFIMREDDFVLLKYNEKVHIMVMKNGFSDIQQAVASGDVKATKKTLS